ncbi:MAG: helix-turn-helix domain-containing protein [Eubacterium sp.]|nr:helix-turn-helix domain-containing protein [Eubacterium sp.]
MGKRLTTSELAKELGLTAYAVTTMRKQGLLPYIKIGIGQGRIFYDLELVNKALDKIAEDNAKKQAELYDSYMKSKYPEVVHMGILGR